MPKKLVLVVTIFAIGYALFALIIGDNGIFAQLRIQKQNQSLNQSIDSLESLLTKKKSEKMSLLKDSFYIESTIRKQFGMARKNEKVFLFIPNHSALRNESTQPPTSPSSP